MTKFEKIRNDNPSCRHSWAAREKVRVQTLHRFCTICGDEDLTTDCDALDAVTMRKLHKKEAV